MTTSTSALNKVSYPGLALLALGVTAAMAATAQYTTNNTNNNNNNNNNNNSGGSKQESTTPPAKTSHKKAHASPDIAGAGSVPPPATLTPAQVAIVKSTAPLLKEHGEAITSLFYRNMITSNPSLNNVFNRTSQVTGAQPRALAHAVFAYASHVDDLAALSAAVARMADKHVSLGIRPDQYPIVGEYLIAAVAEVLGDAVTAEVAEAWTNAYNVLANILIDAERELYAGFRGWDGWRRFTIQEKVAESSEITSFRLVPVDGQPLPGYKPGQYVSLRVWVDELGCMQPRQYSLCEDPDRAAAGAYYRIAVKREPAGAAGTPAGMISNRLHDEYHVGDEVELTHPCGVFFLDETAPKSSPVVLISAGVGITPMISILNHITAATPSSSRRPISFIHGARTAGTQAFAEHLRSLAAAHPNLDTTIFRSHSVEEHEVQGTHYHFAGSRINLAKVDAERKLFLHDPEARYYICGPLAFMHQTQAYLREAGVDDGRIHMEVFNTGGV